MAAKKLLLAGFLSLFAFLTPLFFTNVSSASAHERNNNRDRERNSICERRVENNRQSMNCRYDTRNNRNVLSLRERRDCDRNIVGMNNRYRNVAGLHDRSRCDRDNRVMSQRDQDYWNRYMNAYNNRYMDDYNRRNNVSEDVSVTNDITINASTGGNEISDNTWVGDVSSGDIAIDLAINTTVN